MKPITTYEDWLALDESQKTLQSERWNAYQREGLGFVLCAAGRLVLSTASKVVEARPSIYHGGEWIIHAYVPASELPALPKPLEQTFEGFRVIWLGEDKPK